MEMSILPPHPLLLLLWAACGIKLLEKNPKGKFKWMKHELLGDESVRKTVPFRRKKKRL